MIRIPYTKKGKLRIIPKHNPVSPCVAAGACGLELTHGGIQEGKARLPMAPGHQETILLEPATRRVAAVDALQLEDLAAFLQRAEAHEVAEVELVHHAGGGVRVPALPLVALQLCIEVPDGQAAMGEPRRQFRLRSFCRAAMPIVREVGCAHKLQSDGVGGKKVLLEPGQCGCFAPLPSDFRSVIGFRRL